MRKQLFRKIKNLKKQLGYKNYNPQNYFEISTRKLEVIVNELEEELKDQEREEYLEFNEFSRRSNLQLLNDY